MELDPVDRPVEATSGSLASHVVMPTVGGSRMGSTKRLIESGTGLSRGGVPLGGRSRLKFWRVHWIHGHQLNVEISEHLQRAVQAGLIWHPSDQVGQAEFASADLESVHCRDQRRTQSSLHHDFEASGIQEDLLSYVTLCGSDVVNAHAPSSGRTHLSSAGHARSDGVRRAGWSLALWPIHRVHPGTDR